MYLKHFSIKIYAATTANVLQQLQWPQLHHLQPCNPIITLNRTKTENNLCTIQWWWIVRIKTFKWVSKTTSTATSSKLFNNTRALSTTCYKQNQTKRNMLKFMKHYSDSSWRKWFPNTKNNESIQFKKDAKWKHRHSRNWNLSKRYYYPQEVYIRVL